MTCIGLFGTCGNSTWRDAFMAEYAKSNIEFYNPQVDDWHPGLADDENRHLAEDEIILFPVTEETTGQGSLAEIGFSIQHALRLNRQRYFIFLIEDECKDPNASEAQIKDSNRSRKLVKSKLVVEAKQCYNIFLVDSLEEMLTLSIQLNEICVKYNEIASAKA